MAHCITISDYDKMRKISYYLCIVCILLLVFALLWENYGADRATEKSAGGNGIVTEITRATELNQQAGAENKSAISHIERAGEYAKQAMQGNKSAQAILAELRADNQRAKCIIDEIIRGASQGTEEN